MYPPLMNFYAAVVQLEREKEVLRLSEEARLLREAKVVISSQPKVNLKRLLTIFNGERVRQREAIPISFQSSANCCSNSKTVQCQTC